VSLTFQLEGLEETVQILDSLPKSLQTRTLKRVLREPAQPIADLAQRLAPRVTGRTAESIVVTDRLNRTQAREARREGKYQAEIYIGTTKRNATPREFGSWRTLATPFMRPAWDALKMVTKAAIETALVREVTATATRLSRRVARLASGR
jgi:HK97 gp10 family phage protein